MGKDKKRSDAVLIPAVNSAGQAVSVTPPGVRKWSRRKRRIWLTILALFLSFILLAAIFTYRRATATIRIGPDTTFITGPLKPDGTVDYAAAYNLTMGKGVTPKNNAAIPLLRIFGANKKVLGSHWRQILKEMHFTAGRRPVPHWVNFKKYLKQHPAENKELLAAHMAPYLMYTRRLRKHAWHARQFPVYAAYLRYQAPALRAIRHAVLRAKFFIPLPNIALFDAPLPPGSEISYRAGRILDVQAMLDVSRGRFSAALRDFSAARRLARLSPQGGRLVGYLARTGVSNRINAAAIALATNPRIHLPRSFYLRLLAQVAGHRGMHFAAVINYSQRMMALDVITIVFRICHGHGPDWVPQHVSKGQANILLPAVIDWNWVLRWFNAMFNEETRIEEMRPRSARFAAYHAFIMKRIRKHWKSTLLTDLQPTKAFRDDMLMDLMPDIEQAVFVSITSRQRRRFARVCIALALKHLASGHFPRTLKDLVPKYLPAIPHDAFTGKALEYRRTKTGYVLTCDWHSADAHLSKRRRGQLLVSYPEPPPKPLKPYTPPPPFHAGF